MVLRRHLLSGKCVLVMPTPYICCSSSKGEGQLVHLHLAFHWATGIAQQSQKHRLLNFRLGIHPCMIRSRLCSRCGALLLSVSVGEAADVDTVTFAAAAASGTGTATSTTRPNFAFSMASTSKSRRPRLECATNQSVSYSASSNRIFSFTGRHFGRRLIYRKHYTNKK